MLNGTHDEMSPEPPSGEELRRADFLVDLAIYPLEIVKAAAYVFVDRCYVFLDKAGEGTVRVSLSTKGGQSQPVLALAGELKNELLSQALRHDLGARHGKARELLLARALFGAAPKLAVPGPTWSEEKPSSEGLPASPDVIPDEDEDDYLDDPLGIAVPWEEKYGGAASASPAPAPEATPVADLPGRQAEPAASKPPSSSAPKTGSGGDDAS